MSNINRNRLGVLIAVLAVLGLVGAALSQGFFQRKVEPVNRGSGGVALKGYDAVAYFQDGRPVKGRAEFQQEWMGARWYFASAANRDLFASRPEKYAPQYGGYCAWAASNNYTADTDPEAWRIVDGKLYLNYDKSVQKMWEKDIPGRIKKADENWPRLHK